MLVHKEAKEEIRGTKYVMKYIITQETEEIGHTPEYGIRCELFNDEEAVSAEEVKKITTDLTVLRQIFRKIVKNQVFPIHLRDVVEDLLVEEYEVRKNIDFEIPEHQRTVEGFPGLNEAVS